MSGPLFRGGSLVRENNKTRIALKSITKPITLTVHANPILGRSDCAMAGKTMPPVPPPQAARDTAAARRRLEK